LSMTESVAAPVGRVRPLRRALLFLLKAGLAVALLHWMVRRSILDFGVLSRLAVDSRTIGLCALGLACVFLAVALLAKRLTLILRHRDLPVPFSRALGLTLIGALFGSVLPGLVGGDVVKAVYLCTDARGRRVEALAGVMVDRVLGLYSLLLLGTLALGAARLAHFEWVSMPILMAAPTAVAALTAGMVMIAWDAPARWGAVRAVFVRLPGKIQTLIRSLRSYLKSPALMLRVVALSLCVHGLTVIAFVIAASLLRDGLQVSAHFVLNPLAMAMNMVPLTPGGLGLAEGAFGYLFEQAGSSNGAIIGLLGRLIQYTVFGIGGAVALMAMKVSLRE